MTFATGTRFGPYEILSSLGAGGMGEVYLAEDSRLHRKVALKLLPSGMAANEDRMRRFKQEATYAWIADSYASMPAYPYLSPKQAFPKSQAAARRALEIDPTLPEAHT